MTAIPTRPTSAPDVTAAMHELVVDIEHLIAKACDTRLRMRRDPELHLSTRALSEMIDVLGDAKLRLRVDASGYHRT